MPRTYIPLAPDQRLVSKFLIFVMVDIGIVYHTLGRFQAKEETHDPVTSPFCRNGVPLFNICKDSLAIRGFLE